MTQLPDKDEVERLLYGDEDGEIEGLDEAQLIDPPPLERVPAVRTILYQHPDPTIRFDALLVLTAWGDDEALALIGQLLKSRDLDAYELAPDRITDQDNAYDELAGAVHIYTLTKEAASQPVLDLYRQFLSLYPHYFFRGKLKSALLKIDAPALVADVVAAIQGRMATGHVYQASQLLPVLARWDAAAAMAMIPPLLTRPAETPDPVNNVAEALGYIDSAESRRQLEAWLRHSDAAVVEEASRAFARLNGELRR